MARKKAATVTAAQAGIIYCRVSTTGQDDDRQIRDCLAYAEAHGIPVTKTVREVISSRKSDRALYSEVLASLRPGDVIVTAELSRLARSMLELNGIISAILGAGAALHVVSAPINVIDGSIASQAVVFACGIAAQIERDMISERTKSGLAARAASGVQLGRPRGSHRAVQAIQEKKIDTAVIDAMIASGASKASIARLLQVNIRTLNKYLDSKS